MSKTPELYDCRRGVFNAGSLVEQLQDWKLKASNSTKDKWLKSLGSLVGGFSKALGVRYTLEVTRHSRTPYLQQTALLIFVLPSLVPLAAFDKRCSLL